MPVRAGVPVAVTPSAVSTLEHGGAEGWRALGDGATWLCMNASEATALTGESDPQRAAGRLAAEGPTVLVTAAECGAWAAMPREAARHVPSVVSTRGLVDTTGAGDAAAGAFLAHLLLGSNVWQAAALAMGAAATAVGQRGAWAPL